MKKTNKFIMLALMFILYLLIGGGCVNAASASIEADKTTVNVGDNVNVTLSYTAAAWELHVGSSLTTSSTTEYASATEDAKNASYTKKIVYKASTAGTYSINLTGTVSDENDEESYAGKSVHQTISITVKESSNSSSSNNNSSSSNNGTSSKPNTSTTTAPSFTSVSETVYCTSDGVNVRASSSTDSSVLGSLSKDQSIKRIGVAKKAVNGITWSKVTYNGQTAYVSSAYLTKTKPVITETEEKKDNDKKEDEKEETKKSNNKNLKSLTVTPSSISPKFNTNTTEYAMTIGNDVDKVTIKAEAEDEKATVVIEGNTNLKIGENTITIKVTAEDETVRTYKISVTKEKKNQVGLKELLIEGINLIPEFDTNTYIYTVDIDNTDISELNITATANKKTATIEIIGNTNLAVGSNIITILVKESDTEIATYQINVNITEAMVDVSKENNRDLIKKTAMGTLGAIVLIAIVVTIVRLRKDNEVEEDDGRYNYNDVDESNDEENEELPKYTRKYKREEKETQTDNDDDENSGRERKTGKHF